MDEGRKDPRTNQDKRALTLTEAAEFACVSRGMVNTWVVSGMLPYEEFPGRGDGSHKFRRIRKSDLTAFLDKHCHNPKDSRKVSNPRGEIVLSEREPS